MSKVTVGEMSTLSRMRLAITLRIPLIGTRRSDEAPPEAPAAEM
jgi:hypothetical protein